VPQRDESTTALQALTQWNNRLVEAMSEKVAERFQSEPDPVKVAFQQVLARLPSAQEEAVLNQYLKQHGPAALARVLFNLNAFVYVD
jgi:DNA-directed RNA polymerase specialized sigma24 family protein